MSIHPVVFPEAISDGCVGGPSYFTSIASSLGGFEQRNINWDRARLRWSLSQELIDRARRDTLIAFYRARKGRAFAFLFRDPSDFRVGGIIGPGGVFQHSAAHNFAVGNGSQTQFQIARVYEPGPYQEVRPIKRIKAGVRMYLNGTHQTSGVSVNLSTGIATFTTPPGNGVNVGWSGEFYVLARFDSDVMQLFLDGIGGEWGDIQIVEVRE